MRSSDKDSGLLGPILSGIAGIGAVFAAISPLITQTQIASLFIDQKSVGYMSVVTFLLAVLTLWLFASRTAGLIFIGKIDIKILARVRVGLLLLFLLSSFSFYWFYMSLSHKVVDYALAATLQSISYISSFFFVTAFIGMQYRDTYEQFRWRNEEDNRTSRLRSALLGSGYIEIDLKITSIQTLMFDPTRYPDNWQNAYFILFETNGKSMAAIADSSSKNILNVEERNPSENIESVKERMLSVGEKTMLRGND